MAHYTQSKVKKIVKNGFNQLGRLLIAVLLFLLLIVVYQSVRHPGQPPSFLGYEPYTVLSNSMSPYFKTGDLVIVKKVRPSDVSVNDVITFHKADKTVTHRVIKINKSHGNVSFITKGDNNNVKDDGVVAGRDLIGKQIYHIWKGGYVTKFISSPVGFGILVILPLAGFLFLELYERLTKSISEDRVKGQSQE